MNNSVLNAHLLSKYAVVFRLPERHLTIEKNEMLRPSDGRVLIYHPLGNRWGFSDEIVLPEHSATITSKEISHASLYCCCRYCCKIFLTVVRYFFLLLLCCESELCESCILFAQILSEYVYLHNWFAGFPGSVVYWWWLGIMTKSNRMQWNDQRKWSLD